MVSAERRLGTSTDMWILRTVPTIVLAHLEILGFPMGCAY